MVMDKELASVRLWGKDIGAIFWDRKRELGVFEYHPDFLNSGIEICPLMMPLRKGNFSFPALNRDTYKGLPGLLADSLPDRFGNMLINAWLERNGRDKASMTPVEKLLYIGTRGMGALEYHPPAREEVGIAMPIELEQLIDIANQVLDERKNLHLKLENHTEMDVETLNELIRVGTSAGGARAKAIVAYHPETKEIRSGQVDAPEGFEHWIIKFDGIEGNKDKELNDPKGFGRIEYAYFLMAKAAGIEMRACQLLEENQRSHFMTRRFDRKEDGEKVHMLSLNGMAHMDFNDNFNNSYEQAFRCMLKTGVPQIDIEELYRRMLFNVVARNQDDHTKNISFLMDKKGKWRLSPAYDVCYSYNPRGEWTAKHQMSIQGKFDNFELEDFKNLAEQFQIKRWKKILQQIQEACMQWSSFTQDAGLEKQTSEAIQKTFRSF